MDEKKDLEQKVDWKNAGIEDWTAKLQKQVDQEWKQKVQQKEMGTWLH